MTSQKWQLNASCGDSAKSKAGKCQQHHRHCTVNAAGGRSIYQWHSRRTRTTTTMKSYDKLRQQKFCGCHFCGGSCSMGSCSWSLQLLLLRPLIVAAASWIATVAVVGCGLAVAIIDCLLQSLIMAVAAVDCGCFGCWWLIFCSWCLLLSRSLTVAIGCGCCGHWLWQFLVVDCWFHDGWFVVAVINHQDKGRSNGNRITSCLLQQRVLVAVIEVLTARKPGENTKIIYNQPACQLWQQGETFIWQQSTGCLVFQLSLLVGLASKAAMNKLVSWGPGAAVGKYWRESDSRLAGFVARKQWLWQQL